MRRRDFITLLGGAVAWPLVARAQRAAKLPTIGVLGPTTPSAASQWTTALVQRLRELGWIEGHTLAIEYRWAEGRANRVPEIAAEFVRMKVDIIVTAGAANVVAAMQATSVIPIVFAGVGDPVGIGVATSLARPGRNATGLSNQSTDLAAKRIELLREAIPSLHRLGVMANPDGPHTMLEMIEVQTAAATLGLEVVMLEIRRMDDIAPALEKLKGDARALNVLSGPLMLDKRVAINTLALGARLPTMHGVRAQVVAGGLMSYAPNFLNQAFRAGDYVDKILRGARPADLPIQQPTKFDLIINLKTAKALALDVPPTLLARADEVIE